MALATRLSQIPCADCNLYVMPKLPADNDLQRKKGSYIWLRLEREEKQDNNSLFYIKRDGTPTPVPLIDIDLFKRKLQLLQNQQVQQRDMLTLSPEQIADLITSNGGHIPAADEAKEASARNGAAPLCEEKKRRAIKHNPDAAGEAMCIPLDGDGIPEIILDYLGGDLKTKEDISFEKRQRFRLFGRDVPSLLRFKATQVATLLLGGETEEVAKAINLVKDSPALLRCSVEARDRSGSPALCLMTDDIELPLYDFFFFSGERIEPNKLYLSMDAKGESLSYQVEVQTTFLGKRIITATIPINKLVPPIDPKQKCTRELLEKYRAQILKIASQRGHIDNKLYIKKVDDEEKNKPQYYLKYQVLTPEGLYVQSSITQEELNQEIKGPLTLEKLNELQGAILEITSRRKHTPLGRVAKGTPLQIAAMCRDVGLAWAKKEEDRGMVERLKLAGDLSQEEFIKQLEVITGDEAKRQNTERNQRIQNVLEKFCEAICRVPTDDMVFPNYDLQFEAFQARCQPFIDQLEEELRSDPKEVIQSGYLLDLSVLQYVSGIAEWFEENMNTMFGGSCLYGDVFCVNAYGALQKKLSACDGHVFLQGIAPVVIHREIPSRTLNSDVKGPSSHFTSSSKLGRDFYLGLKGASGIFLPGTRRGAGGAVFGPFLEHLDRARTVALQNLCEDRRMQNRRLKYSWHHNSNQEQNYYIFPASEVLESRSWRQTKPG